MKHKTYYIFANIKGTSYEILSYDDAGDDFVLYVEKNNGLDWEGTLSYEQGAYKFSTDDDIPDDAIAEALSFAENNFGNIRYTIENYII